MRKRTAFGLPRTKDTVLYLRDRNKILCVFAAICLAVLVGFMAGSHGYISDPPKRGNEIRDYVECKAENTYAESCIAVTESTADLTKAGNASNDNADPANSEKYGPNKFIKDKRDLNAQEGMWRATNLLAFYTLLQIFLGAIGLIVVALTLKQTGQVLVEARKATMHAARSTDAAFIANRAYVMVEKISVGNVEVDNSNLSFNSMSVTFEFKNFGNSPASNVEFNTCFFATRSSSDIECSDLTLRCNILAGNKYSDIPPGVKRRPTIRPGTSTVTDFVGPFPLSDGAKQSVFVFYRIAFVDTQGIHRKSDGCFRVVSDRNQQTGQITSSNILEMIRPNVIVQDERGYEYKD